MLKCSEKSLLTAYWVVLLGALPPASWNMDVWVMDIVNKTKAYCPEPWTVDNFHLVLVFIVIVHLCLHYRVLLANSLYL